MVDETDIRNIRADDLRYLAALSETGRLVAAARSLGVDHSTVSRRLRQLEVTLGTRLVGRGHDSWVLTPEGRIVAEHGRAIREAVESAARSVATVVPDDLTGTVRVTAADGFGSLFVVPSLTRLRTQHPRLTVELVTGAHRLTLGRADFDLALVIGTPPRSRLLIERLCSYDSAFYASGSYLAEYGDPASVEELRRHPLIYLIDSLERVREHDLDVYVPGAEVRFASTNIFALVEAARSGGGVAFLPKFMAVTAPELRRVAAPVSPARMAVSLALRRESVDRDDMQAVRSALHQEVVRRRDELVWST